MCTAGEAGCVDDELHVCNDGGDAVEITACEFGCDDDGSKCWGPLAVDAGDSLCVDPGESAQLQAMTSGGDGVYTFSWTPLDTLDDASKQDPLATPLGPTTYTVDISDGEGNVASDKVSVYLKGQALTLSPEVCTTHDFPHETDPATHWVWELCQTVNGRGSALFCGWDLDNATITGTFSVKTVDELTTAGWKDNTDYVFELTHKAAGEMTIVVKEKDNLAVVAETTFMDTTYPRGKFGMYTKSQVSACFSGFSADCI
jgi:hypothetical protein